MNSKTKKEEKMQSGPSYGGVVAHVKRESVPAIGKYMQNNSNEMHNLHAHYFEEEYRTKRGN